ncbi:MAG: AAA family ATPase [Planctomycetia bacterium]|nr:AAA family ATPase [Planctomycetia bacterium]
MVPPPEPQCFRPPLLIDRLLDPAAYSHPTASIRLVETHISWVILTGPFAYKLKKPVRFGFVDYGTLDLRRRSCEGEVRVSSRFAPELYVAAAPITGTPEHPRVGGVGEPIEWAVKLVQFDEADRLDNRFAAGRLSSAECRLLGEAIANVEERLPMARHGDPWGTAESVLAAATVNLATIRTELPEAATRVELIEAWLRERLAAAASLLLVRQAAGRVRECHGDLHLANIVLHEGRMTAFDAIEFSDNLRWIDVANDVAFLVMDLESRGCPDLAAQVVSSWVEAADDHAALAVLPVYETYRAIVRASIAALRGGQGHAESRAEALRYLDLAERLTVTRTPVMAIMSGVSGSGKSSVAAELVGRLPAVRIRSDVERKRLAGMRPTERPGAGGTAALYGESSTRRVYERLASLAGMLLDAGSSVVVDAACTRRWQRDLLARVAADRGVAVLWIAFDLPAEVMLARVAAREAGGGDPSDASVEVVRRQLAVHEPIADDEVAGDGTLVRVAAVGVGSDPATVAGSVAAIRDRMRNAGS